MSLLLSARSIAERALRKIRAFSIADTAADPAELSEALSWLDMIAASLAGSNKLFWLVKTDVVVALTADTASYDLETLLGADLPADGVLFVTHAAWRDSSGIDTPIPIKTRTEYEEITDKDQTGNPWAIYIDRLESMTLYVLGVPSASGNSLVLTLYSYPKTMNLRNGADDTGFAAEWNLFLVKSLAAEIGDGPVRKLDRNDIASWKKEADIHMKALNGFTNREQRGPRARRTRAWGA